jgi:molecular chaperone HscB
MSDYFAVFGLSRKLQLDDEELRRRFYELSRRHHPDFHQLAGEDEQAAALAASALINRAYRALREPLARVEYLVALEEGRDGDEGKEVKATAPMDLLQEMLEVQEALEEAKTSGLDEESRGRLREERQRLVDRRAATEAEIVARGAAWDAALEEGRDRAPLLAWFKQALATRAYLRTVIVDLSEALGEDQDAHVSHRRH